MYTFIHFFSTTPSLTAPSPARREREQHLAAALQEAGLKMAGKSAEWAVLEAEGRGREEERGNSCGDTRDSAGGARALNQSVHRAHAAATHVAAHVPVPPLASLVPRAD